MKPILAVSLLKPTVEPTDDNILREMKSLRYPVLASLKKDGIRALRCNGSLYSRSGKLIPNKRLRNLSICLAPGMDCELWNKDLSYDEVQSIVMSHEHSDTDKIEFHLLDWSDPSPKLISYAERCHNIMQFMREYCNPYTSDTPLVPIKFSPPTLCENAEQLFAYFLMVEHECGEGICFRLPNSPYKEGRSTLKEQYLVKLCRYHTSECIIEGFLEEMENTNRMEWNSVGKMDRSKSIDGLKPKGTLGSFLVRDCKSQLQFRIGTGVGLTEELRQRIWDNQSKFLGKIITYKSKKHGEKIKPRSPVFKSFREPIDLI